ncbi:tyrosine-protein kinase Etk/Wzc [Thioalkalivibrio sp. ALE21]|uniref:polysaccharide biosynthesis tyrosine autokinase n=1 Tax=Thioalkalivibrio sp. ALE21 TaxID=1158175 RepID=UPI000D9B7B4D|nr:polysaccharide biosynthesis tyrosine autokinase [Thioalkalivibrio sp. ALE21]PYF99959.1 tyrosine-protein kinase Etk/Wzc [Thioalkalivibrio sp. ALE21]
MTQTPASPPPADDEIDLGRLLGLLLDHKWWIVGITFLFMLGGGAYATLSTPVYQADALVQVEDTGGVSAPLNDMREMLGREPRASAELEILRSRMVLGQAVDRERLDLIVRPVRLPVIGDFLVRRDWDRSRAAVLGGVAERYAWSGESLTVGDLRVTPAMEGETLTLQVTGEDQFRLAHDDRVLGEGRTGEEASFLDGQIILFVEDISAGAGARFELQRHARLAAIRDLRNRFQATEQGNESGVFSLTFTHTDSEQARGALNAISDIYRRQNVERQAAEAEQSLEFLEEQVPQVRARLREAEDALNEYQVEQESVDMSMETQAVLDRLVDLERQITELEFEEAEISRRYTQNHPTYVTLLEKREQLENERRELQQEIGGLPETQQQVLRLQRDVEVNQEVYVQLLNRMQEMDITRASTVGNVRILDDAAVLPSPVEPQRGLIVALATVLGGMLSVALVLLRGMLNRGVESQEQIEELDLPVYATVPLSDVQQKLVKRLRRRRDLKSGRRRGATGEEGVVTGVLASYSPTDGAIEALRGLRSSLHFAMLEAADNRLVITGPSPGVGKSFISVNLAAVCAQAGQKVLVVDADMRKGHVHHAFGEASAGGLSDLLSEKLTPGEAIRHTDIEGLDYMARGSAPPNPAELLMNERFTRFLDQASEQYDLVLIDTPPILAVTDASVVARHCSTTLMVVRFQLNPPREIEAARRRLESAGVETRGAILNSMEATASASYGYGYYHYSYK